VPATLIPAVDPPTGLYGLPRAAMGKMADSCAFHGVFHGDGC
jgi:hypothetical protein